MDGLLRDLRFTVLNMGRSPGLAVVIAASLALGIGANTAIFSLIQAIMLESLPVEQPIAWCCSTGTGRPGRAA
jgi:hypothetical protein